MAPNERQTTTSHTFRPLSQAALYAKGCHVKKIPQGALERAAPQDHGLWSDDTIKRGHAGVFLLIY